MALVVWSLMLLTLWLCEAGRVILDAVPSRGAAVDFPSLRPVAHPHLVCLDTNNIVSI